MKNLILLLLISLLSISCQQKESDNAQATVTNGEEQKILRNLKEVQWPKAYREQDTVLLDAILGHDFQMVDAQGNWSDKTMELEWIKKQASSYDSFFYEIKRLDVLPNGTAMICGTGHIYNDSIHTIYQSSNVLVKRKGAWKAIASHVSGIQRTP